jgi:hypothetical protein
MYAPGCSLSARIPHEEQVCAARDSLPTEPDMRGYAAIAGVFRQKPRFLPDRATTGFNPIQARSGRRFEWRGGLSQSSVWPRRRWALRRSRAEGLSAFCEMYC